MKTCIAKSGKLGFEDYVVHDGYLFKGKKLCVPKGSFRELIMREAHSGGLTCHFGVTKPLRSTFIDLK